MKRIIVLATVFMLLAMAIAPAAAAPPADETQPPQAPSADNDIFLPLALQPGAMLSGRVTTDRPTMNRDGSLTEIPLSGVVVSDGLGHTALTDANGVYGLAFSGNPTTLTFTKAGYNFGAPVQVAAGQPLNGLNATGIRTGGAPEAPEALLIPNPGFDIVPYYWNRLSLMANGWTPQYTSAANFSPFYSMFTGVANGGGVNNPFSGSFSAVRSHEIFIPAAATSAVVTFRVLLRTQEAPAAAPPAEDGSAQAPEAADAMLSQAAAMEMYKNVDIDSTEAPEATEDVQFFRLVDPNNNHSELATAMALRQNSAGWTLVTYNIPASLYGRTVKLEFGTINDANFLRTQAWFDDVQVEINGGGGATTCTTTQVLTDPTFEANDAAWVGKNTVRPDLNDFSTNFAFSPTNSFLTGVDPTDVNPYPGGWTTGEVFQLVNIPADAVSAWLTVNVLPRSNQWLGWYSPTAWPYWGPMPAAYADLARFRYEQQYGYIADNNTVHPGPEGIRLLFKFWGAFSNTWLRRSYNLIAYRGYPMSILFGASNDGWGGNNALYIDDITLNVCAPAAAAPTP